MKRAIRVIAIPIFFFGLLSVKAYADKVSEDKGITVSPVKFELSGKPGETISEQIKLYNVTNSEKTLYFRALNFEPYEESGFPSFIFDDDSPYDDSLKDWIVFRNDSLSVYPIAPDQSAPVSLNFDINIPEDAVPGGHYAAIIESLEPFDEELDMDASGMVVSPDSAVLVILNVEGDVHVNGQSEEFFVADPYSAEKKPVYWFEYAPIEVISRVRNSGNTHFKPQGNVFIYKHGELIKAFTFNEEEGNVLKDSVRRFSIGTWGEDEVFITRVPKLDKDGNEIQDKDGNTKTRLKINWDKISHIPIGKYEAKLAVVYDGEDGKEVIHDSIEFWIFPWKLIVLIVVSFIVITGWVILRLKKKRAEKVEESIPKKTSSSKKKSPKRSVSSRKRKTSKSKSKSRSKSRSPRRKS